MAGGRLRADGRRSVPPPVIPSAAEREESRTSVGTNVRIPRRLRGSEWQEVVYERMGGGACHRLSFRAPQSARNPERAWVLTSGFLAVFAAQNGRRSFTSGWAAERATACHSERRRARGIPNERGY